MAALPDSQATRGDKVANMDILLVHANYTRYHNRGCYSCWLLSKHTDCRSQKALKATNQLNADWMLLIRDAIFWRDYRHRSFWDRFAGVEVVVSRGYFPSSPSCGSCWGLEEVIALL